MTSTQHQLYRAFSKTGEVLTPEEPAEIETEALVKNGMNPVYGDTYAPDGSIESSYPSAPGDFTVTEQRAAGRRRVEGAYYELNSQCGQILDGGGGPGPTLVAAGAVHLAQTASVTAGEVAGAFELSLQDGRTLKESFTASICSDTVDN